VLVAGNTNNIPPLVQALSGESVTMSEDDYGTMFVVFVPQVSKTKVVSLRY
jgi:hypothetical protein